MPNGGLTVTCSDQWHWSIRAKAGDLRTVLHHINGETEIIASTAILDQIVDQYLALRSELSEVDQ